jgi:uncharacterized repeat protein (TIGR04138 family)
MPKSAIDSFEEKLRLLTKQDQRYHLNAYRFIYEALEHSLSHMGKRRHITGKELLDAVRKLGIDKFGFLAKTVFENWGVKKTRDFGEIVFNLVNSGLMGKTPEDSVEDFDGIFDFEEVFEKNFSFELPSERKPNKN